MAKKPAPKRLYEFFHRPTNLTLFAYFPRWKIDKAIHGVSRYQQEIAIAILRRIRRETNLPVSFVNFSDLEISISKQEFERLSRKQEEERMRYFDENDLLEKQDFSPLEHHCGVQDCEYCDAEQFEFCPRNLEVE